MESIISQVALSAILLSGCSLAAPTSLDQPEPQDKGLFRRYYYYDNGGGFPTAAIAGIVIGVVVFISGIAIRCCFIYNARKRSQTASQNIAQYQGTSMQQNPNQAPGPQPYNPNNPGATAGMVGSPGNVNYAGMYNGYTGYSAGYDSTKAPDQTTQPVQGFAPPQQPPPQQNYQVSVSSPSSPPPAHVANNNNASYGYDVGPAPGYQSAQVYDPTLNQSNAPEIKYGR